jgi:hypothetical protein
MATIDVNKCGNIHLKLDNGIIVSIFIGFGSYTENRNKKSEVYVSKNCEIAFLDKKDNFITRDVMSLIDKKYLELNDDVIGYIEINYVLDLIEKVRKLKFY